MYVPPKFSLGDEDAWSVVRDAGAGALVIATPTGLASVFVPVVVSDDRGTITSHLARANSWWRSVTPDMEILALFLAASTYVSPTNYPSRAEHPGVVPTWNYVAAEVRGRVRLHDGAEWKLRQVSSVTDQFERDRTPAWHVHDAPPEFISQQLQAIVGIEIEVLSVQGKAKLSQNRPDLDRDCVAEQLAHGTLGERLVAERMRRSD